MRAQRRQKAPPKFPTVTVNRLGKDGKPDGTVHTMSEKTWHAVHEGGQFFELAKKAEK